MAMLIPEAWENMPYMDPVLRAFYEYHACLTEPWDGPAAVAFTDGVVAAAVLDRNGLRPARYKIDDDNIFVMASEVGATYMDDAHVIEKGRLGPGQMIAVDTEQKALLRNDEIKARLAQRQPYGDWLSRKMVTVDSLKADADSVPATRATIPVQRAFAYTSEEAHLVLRPLYLDGVEPVGSLGDDTPLSILAHKPRQLYTYFRQRFAQVTNPPIDSYREQLVMSLYTYLGVRGSLLEETEEHAAQLRLASPILTDAQLAAIKGADSPLRTETLSVLFPVAEGTEGLKRVLDEVCAAAASAADAGSTTLILSDRNDNPGDIILDDELLPLLQDAIALKGPVKLEYQIRNVHRTAGARIAGEIARIHGDDGIPDHSIEIRFTGSAGQSFGAFLIHGMHLLLDGEANDYVGKGMHGGELVVRPPAEAQFPPHDNVIVGNTVLYGATGGSMFASGRAGKRFGVRNSGAWAVVEGAGNHACEYMTGGVVVILGPTGRNLGAGMSGGMAFVLDINNDTDTMINPEMVGAEPVDDQHDEEILHALVTRHHELTHSPRAEDVLSNWAAYLPLFKKVSPLPHVAPPAPRERQRARRDALTASSARAASSR